jgi:hypothetical protein
MRSLHAVYFADGRGGAEWRRMARVLEHSARKRCSSTNWTIDVRELDPCTVKRADKPHDPRTYAVNTYKLAAWRAIVDDAHDGDELVLIDTDTMILAPLDPAFDDAAHCVDTRTVAALHAMPIADRLQFPGDSRSYDVAFTWKTNTTTLALNGGVVFVRVNARSRALMRAWCDRNDALFANPVEHARYHPRYGGINQAALGSMLERGETAGARVAFLDCRVWNACYGPLWQTAQNGARVLHCKSTLRRALFANGYGTPDVRALADRWRRADAAAARSVQP